MRKYSYVKPYRQEEYDMKPSKVLFINLFILIHILLWVGPAAAEQARPVGAENRPPCDRSRRTASCTCTWRCVTSRWVISRPHSRCIATGCPTPAAIKLCFTT